MKRRAQWAATLAMVCLGLAACSLLVPINDAQVESVQDASTSVDSGQAALVDAAMTSDASVSSDADATALQQGCIGMVPPQGLCDDFDNGTSEVRTAFSLQGSGIYDPEFDAGFSKPNALRVGFPSTMAQTDAGGRCTDRGDCQGASTGWLEVIPGPVTHAEVSFLLNVTSTRDGLIAVLGYQSGASEVNVYLANKTLRIVGSFRLPDGGITYGETVLAIPMLGGWQKVRVEHDRAANTIHFSINTQSSKFQIPAATEPSAGPLSIKVGARFLEPQTIPAEYLIDDLLVRPLP